VLDRLAASKANLNALAIFLEAEFKASAPFSSRWHEHIHRRKAGLQHRPGRQQHLETTDSRSVIAREDHR
jgi:hypothetical protein